MRQFGLTMQQLFLRQQEPVYRPPQGEIPITYTQQPPPPPPPGAGAVARRTEYGPAKLPKERYAPFQGVRPPPAPGGATAPMPVRERIPRHEEPIRREYFPPRPPPAPAPPPPSGAAPKTKAKKKVKFDDDMPKFPSSGGHRMPDGPETFPHWTPYRGQAHKLPSHDDDSHELRANAIQRMRELHEQKMQTKRKSEMLDRKDDLGRAIRRGGQRGDVVGPGKRKREAEDFFPNPRQRISDITSKLQRFSIAT